VTYSLFCVTTCLFVGGALVFLVGGGLDGAVVGRTLGGVVDGLLLEVVGLVGRSGISGEVVTPPDRLVATTATTPTSTSTLMRLSATIKPVRRPDGGSCPPG
jgi:hypothetical protein